MIFNYLTEAGETDGPGVMERTNHQRLLSTGKENFKLLGNFV